MTTAMKHDPGAFCWADLATTDAEGAKAFYTGLLGWTPIDMPVGDTGMLYSMMTKDGKNVCAMYQMTPDMGPHPCWNNYVSVENADESVERARQLGGTVLMPPADVLEAGRMAVLQDPTGAVISIWQPKAHAGAEVMGELNSLCWHELYTRDTGAASAFYSGLFGWTVKDSAANPDGAYTEFSNNGRPIAGMLEIREEWGDMPPNWSLYFSVADCDGALKKAEELGGSRVMPPMDIEGIGRLVFIKDPQGAYFAVIRLAF